jgi:hypothetical protein
MTSPSDGSNIQNEWTEFKKWILKEGRRFGAQNFHLTLEGKQRNLELARKKAKSQGVIDATEINNIDTKLGEIALKIRARDCV